MEVDSNSILTSVKKAIGGIYECDEDFDSDIIMFINSEFAELCQLGVGPEEGFEIEDKTSKWTDFISDKRLNFVQQYITIKVKMVFDPPQSSFVMDALNKKAEELKWRLNVAAEQLKDEGE
jgi:hypothetical protein